MELRENLLNSYNNRMKGFTLIELLVAAALSMIVLIAAGSGFFTTQRLSKIANDRLQVQQDLRNAANMIVRDARMAGAFGCFNLAKQASGSEANDHDGGNLKSINFRDQNQGVKFINSTDASSSLNNFAISNGKVLVFTYGLGSSSGYKSSSANAFSVNAGSDDELKELGGHLQAPIVVSSCSLLDRFVGAQKQNDNGVLKVTSLPNALSANHDSSSSDFKGETSVFRQAVNVYAIGTPTGGEKGLYLFQLNADGEFSDPQLLLAGVDNWNVQFGYSSGCTALRNDAKIKFESDIRTGNDAIAPTLLKIQLTGVGGGDVKAGRVGSSYESDVQTYYIDATVRGGNSCAERSYDQPA
ncbi:Tfp pilus assembly protein PilW [Kingella potus]|uniref:Tfp pilus assembly protein PilW n=2 Tax=Kingella potus TaxID=265175 RepID=A0A377R029_9NEIS|nr:prepilin-type N-terminal cleavage/methylation domain-containing protein [Kingella potus]STR00863.1 Tfp pilus assembly protein PilW [Kingella potus]